MRGLMRFFGIRSSAILVLSSLMLSPISATAVPAERERAFRRDRGRFRGNERSTRPGRIVPGQLRHGGNGCPEGTMRVIFAPDGLSFTILFDRFVAGTGSVEGGQRGAMSCDAVLSMNIPENQQMEITRVDYRGFVSVPAGGKGALSSMFNFVEQSRGARGTGQWRDRDRILIRYVFSGPQAENYEISTGAMNEGNGLSQTEVSPCGGEARLRIRNAVRVTAPPGQEAQLTIDSIDGSSNAVYFVNWRECRPAGRERPGGWRR